MKSKVLILSAISILTLSCQNESLVIFDVEDVEIRQEGIDKPNVKTDIEFISIAYSDLFDRAISKDELVALRQTYASFGDIKLIEDLIIRNFLNGNQVNLPSSAEMRNDIEAFVGQTYRKFLNRNPNEFELWFLVNEIQGNQTITPELIYYSIMTSNEYRNF